MLLTLKLVLFIAAFVCFVVAALGYNPPRPSLPWVGMALLTVALAIT